MLMTFYKGALVHIWPSHIHWKYAENMTAAESTTTSATNSSTDTLLGAILVIASCFAYSVWFIIQAKMSKSFSSPYTSSAIMCWMAAAECFVLGAVVERNVSAWALGWDIRLYTAIYLVSACFVHVLLQFLVDYGKLHLSVPCLVFKKAVHRKSSTKNLVIIQEARV